MAGRLDDAKRYMTERMTLARQLGQYGGIAAEAANLAMVEYKLGNLDQADSLAREALEIARKREDEWMFPYLFSRLAAVATEYGHLERAATLIGAAEAMMKQQGAAWPPDERPHYEHTLETLSATMAADDFERTRSRGGRLSPTDAVEFALSAVPTRARSGGSE
jgi:hypothetical protein